MLKTCRPQTLTFKVPNRLVLDTALSFSARRMGAVLYSRRNHFGACRRSLASLAKLAVCSVTTARAALTELMEGNYIAQCKNYKYDSKLGRLVYDQSSYQCNLDFKGGYTLIPRSLFAQTLKSSSFVVCLYLYLQAGNGTRCFPSLNRICKDLWIAKSTVCRAIRELGTARLIYAQACIKANRAYSCNSYFFLCVADSYRPAAVISARDVPSSVCRVLHIPSSYRALRRRTLSPHPGPAPFPCHYYKLKKGQFQSILGVGGSFKIGKLTLRLR